MKKIGALIVGIGIYNYERERCHQNLEYPAADADGIEQYILACWPEEPDRHICRIKESEASLAAFQRGFAELAICGPYDLQFVFLSGHGIFEPNERGFMVQPSTRQAPRSLLQPNTLDSFLGLSKAKRTIFILDCCYAEAIIGELKFFSRLDSDDARLFIGSSRASQRTWEDKNAGHGIFTAHLLDLVRTGSSASLSGVKDFLDVDSELFPILCSQVPLYVLEQKGEEQEPIKGGLAAACITLPVSRARRRIAERTPLGTAFRRVRQIGVGVAATIVTLIILGHAMLYHIVPGQSGTLVIRNGTRLLDPLLRYFSQDWVDTGIPSSELSDNPIVSRPLLTGESVGIWTHTSVGKYRSWYDSISAGLETYAARRYNVLIGLRGASPAALLDENSAPAEVAFAAWAALAQDRAESLDLVLSRLPGSGRLVNSALTTFDRNNMDFTILDLTVDGMLNFAQAITYASALDPVRTMPAYVGFAKATTEWLAHNSDVHRGRDAQRRVRDAVADCLGIISRARMDRGLEPIDAPTISHLNALSRSGYAEVINLALSRVSSTAEARTIAVQQLSAFYGDPHVPAQRMALEAIIESLDDTQRSKSTVDEAVAMFQTAGNGESSDLTHLLIAAADTDALSTKLLDQLITAAKRSLEKNQRDFPDAERARVLSHAMRSVPLTDRPSIYALIDLVAKDVTPMSSATAEMYAALGRQKLDRPGMLEHVANQARFAQANSHGSSNTATEPMPGMTILVGRGPWVLALAEYAQNRILPDADVAILRKHLTDPALRHVVIKALVKQERMRVPNASFTSWIDRLREARTARERSMWQNIVSQDLGSMPRSAYLAAIKTIRASRDEEREPEIRIALGMVLAEAALLRIERQQTSLE